MRIGRAVAAILVILVFSLAACAPAKVYGSTENQRDTLTHIEKDDLIERLRDPRAHKRVKAGYKLAQHLSEDELRDIGFDGWRRSSGVMEKPSLENLHTILSAYWPPAANGLVDDIYTIDEKPWTEAFADLLHDEEIWDNIDGTSPISLKLQEAWYQDFRDRKIDLYLWNGVYQYIIDRDWLFDLWINDQGVHRTVRSITLMFADKLDYKIKYGEAEWAVREYLENKPWTKVLLECYEKDQNVMADLVIKKTRFSSYMLGNYRRTDLDYMTYAEIICFLLDKPKWVLDIQDNLEHGKYIYFNFRFNGEEVEQIAIEDEKDMRNPLVKTMALSATGKAGEAKTLLAAYIDNHWEEEFDVYSFDWDHRFTVHHPWFIGIRADKDIWAWWKEQVNNVEFNTPIDTNGIYTDWGKYD